MLSSSGLPRAPLRSILKLAFGFSPNRPAAGNAREFFFTYTYIYIICIYRYIKHIHIHTHILHLYILLHKYTLHTQIFLQNLRIFDKNNRSVFFPLILSNFFGFLRLFFPQSERKDSRRRETRASRLDRKKKKKNTRIYKNNKVSEKCNIFQFFQHNIVHFYKKKYIKCLIYSCTSRLLLLLI